MAAIATMPTRDARLPDAGPAMLPQPGTTVGTGQADSPERDLALLPGTQMAGVENHPDWGLLQRLPMTLTAGIPLPRFRVKDLLALKPGSMVMSDWPTSEDVPFRVGKVQLSWSEFEVVEQRMAVRMTRLA